MGVSRRLVNELEKLIEEGKKLKEEKEEVKLLKQYKKWTLSSIEFLREIFGENSEHLNDFIDSKIKGEKFIHESLRKKLPFLKKQDEFHAILEQQIGILESAKYFVDSGISDLKRIVAFEFYREIIKTSEFLLNKNLKDPAAILAYSILRIISEEKEIISRDEDKEKLKYFYELGKSAVKGEFYLYDKKKVKKMLEWLGDIIKSQLDRTSLYDY